ncbi:hypothetical protein UMZ34_16800 [Halopseudomonas pachastrellae]|nr:hypothetical protein UMZ34_16800 [Halopseudomonas pachastrellae]
MRILAAVFILLVMIGAAKSLFTNGEPAGTGGDMCTDDSYAWAMAQEAVKGQLRAPSTAKFPASPDNHAYGGDCVHAIFGHVDAENAYGATVRQKFDLTMTYDKEVNRWRATGLQLK